MLKTLVIKRIVTFLLFLSLVITKQWFILGALIAYYHYHKTHVNNTTLMTTTANHHSAELSSYLHSDYHRLLKRLKKLRQSGRFDEDKIRKEEKRVWDQLLYNFPELHSSQSSI